jgi:hypothetical protein
MNRWARWFCPKLANPPQEKTMLNKIERFKSFVYTSTYIMLISGTEALVINIEPRRNSRHVNPECGKRCSAYDR